MVNIFLFVPNLIGYARVVLLVASLFFMVSVIGLKDTNGAVCVCACVTESVVRARGRNRAKSEDGIVTGVFGPLSFPFQR
jgi:hypothetical protein